MSSITWERLMQVDKIALDALNDSAEVHLQSLEPWVQVLNLLDALIFILQACSVFKAANAH